MTGTPLQLAVIVGSTREGRFGSTVAEWFVTEARKRDDMTLDVIDLVDVDLPMVYPQLPEPGVKAYIERIDRADAFVVITPEYNHGYPAALKQAIDLPHTQWRRKPVAFVSYGGVGGGLRAVEQLRQVFAELHAVTMRDSVSFHMAWDRFDESGEAREAAGCNAAAETMLDDLAWWATALRNARKADDARLAKGVSTDALEVVVLGRLPEVMERATSVLESHGFSASGVFSEEDVRLAIAEHDDLVAVVTGGAIGRPAQDRLRAAATAKGVALIPASMADGEVLFAKDVIPKLVEARDGPEREG